MNIKMNPSSHNNNNKPQLNNMQPVNTKKRRDHKGTEITKHNKNFKVSFRDKVSKHRLVEIIDIESFKEYNLTEETPSTTTTNTVGCCAIV